jgi:hypothetical protein
VGLITKFLTHFNVGNWRVSKYIVHVKNITESFIHCHSGFNLSNDLFSSKKKSWILQYSFSFFCHQLFLNLVTPFIRYLRHSLESDCSFNVCSIFVATLIHNFSLCRVISLRTLGPFYYLPCLVQLSQLQL